MKFSVLVPFVPKRAEQVLPFAGLVRFGQAERLWQGQSLYIDSHQQFVTTAGAGLRTPIGTGVSLMPLQHPWHAAMQARSVAVAVGQPIVAGYGPGGRPFQQALLGAPYPSPLTACREYLTIMRGLLEGHRVTMTGDYFQCYASLPPLASPPIELGLGVLRSRMAMLAGEVADVAITWLTPADDIRGVSAPATHDGAATARRERRGWSRWFRWRCPGRTASRLRSRWPAMRRTFDCRTTGRCCGNRASTSRVTTC